MLTVLVLAPRNNILFHGIELILAFPYLRMTRSVSPRQRGYRAVVEGDLLL